MRVGISVCAVSWHAGKETTGCTEHCVGVMVWCNGGDDGQWLGWSKVMWSEAEEPLRHLGLGWLRVCCDDSDWGGCDCIAVGMLGFSFGCGMVEPSCNGHS